jgi:hypothetical protein
MVHLIPQTKHTLKFISEIHGSTQTPSTQPCNPHSPTKHTLRHHQSIEINEVYRHWHIKNDYMPVCRLMGGPSIVPGYSRAYPTFCEKKLVVSKYTHMYNIFKLQDRYFVCSLALVVQPHLPAKTTAR